MSDASNRIERYRKLAEGCRRLAATSSSTEMRDRYSRMAKDLIVLADVEEQDALFRVLRRLANSRGPIYADGTFVSHRGHFAQVYSAPNRGRRTRDRASI